MKKGVRFRAYPNKSQRNLIDRTFGCCRLIYNKGLAMRNDAYANGDKIGYNQTDESNITKVLQHNSRGSVNGVLYE